MTDYEFQPGDRIRYIGGTAHWRLQKGDLGTFLGYYEENEAVVLIEWDREHEAFHDNNGLGQNYHCWNVVINEIELVESINSVASVDIGDLL